MSRLDRDQRSEIGLFVRKTAIVAAVLVLVALAWAVREVLLIVFVAAVLAAGIAPAVRRVRILWRFYFKRPLRQGVAVMIVYLPFLVAVILFLVLLVPTVIAQGRDLSARLPTLIEENILQPLGHYVPVDAVRAELRDGVEIPRARVFFVMKSAATVVGAIVAILFMIAYMLIDAARLRNTFLLIYPPSVRGEQRRMLNRIASRMSSWLAGQLMLSLIIGVATFVALAALRIPYALPLAIIAAIGELVPVLGPTIGAVPALAMALLSSPWQFWSVLAFAVLVQKVENLFIVPRVMSKKVQVSPLAVFIAFMVGASLLGILGAILAIPVTAIAQVTFEEAFVARRERRLDADRSGTLLRRVD